MFLRFQTHFDKPWFFASWGGEAERGTAAIMKTATAIANTDICFTVKFPSAYIYTVVFASFLDKQRRGRNTALDNSSSYVKRTAPHNAESPTRFLSNEATICHPLACNHSPIVAIDDEREERTKCVRSSNSRLVCSSMTSRSGCEAAISNSDAEAYDD